jgi:hypothetical protein
MLGPAPTVRTVTVTQSPPSLPSSPTPSGTTENTTPVVFHQGKLEIGRGVAADLDASSADTQWGVVTLPPGASKDIAWNGPFGLTVNHPPFFAGYAQAAAFDAANDATCQNATQYIRGDLPIAATRPGKYICIYTSEKRFSLLHVAKVSTDVNFITFDVTTFKKDGD